MYTVQNYAIVTANEWAFHAKQKTSSVMVHTMQYTQPYYNKNNVIKVFQTPLDLDLTSLEISLFYVACLDE